MKNHTLAERLRACGIRATGDVLRVAGSLVVLDESIQRLDLVSLDRSTLSMLPGVTGKEGKPEILRSFYTSLLPKDLDCIETLLGRCVPAAACAHEFLEERLDIRRVPRLQKELIDSSRGEYTDPITLEQHPLSAVVQLRESGEIMTRESFDELVLRNTTEWQGRENVGFFSLVTNTMIGNAVSYNYDHDQYFPQKPGTLNIKRVPNAAGVPSTTSPMETPSHYFLLSYLGYSFYLPDSPGGRQVLFMMKDCFKKGNLFAFGRNGSIRHGRVHKKTRPQGSAHAYPDNTYLERVSGELFSLGSTLFTYRIGDPLFSLPTDPYPREKRFRITYTE
jgi:hypothetical protein